jgi:hypothetical protein
VFIAAFQPKAGRLHQVSVQIDTTLTAAGNRVDPGL